MGLLEHFEAIKTLLNLAPTLTGKVRDTVMVKAGEPVRGIYVVLNGGGPTELEDERLTAIQLLDSDAVYEFETTSIAPDPTGALAVAAAVEAALIGKTFNVAGRRIGSIRLEESGDVDDVSTMVTPMFRVIEKFSVRSDRG